MIALLNLGLLVGPLFLGVLTEVDFFLLVAPDEDDEEEDEDEDAEDEDEEDEDEEEDEEAGAFFRPMIMVRSSSTFFFNSSFSFFIAKFI